MVLEFAELDAGHPVILTLGERERGTVPRRQDVLHQVAPVDLSPDPLGSGDRLVLGEMREVLEEARVNGILSR